VAQDGSGVDHVEFPYIMNILNHCEYRITIVEYQLLGIAAGVDVSGGVQDGVDRGAAPKTVANFLH
jgi:hypothetical protein